MQAGLLKNIIEIQRSTITQNAETGEQNQVWAQVWRGRASVEFSSGSQLLENNETYNSVTRKVTIRTKPAISGPLSTLRVLIDGEKYRVLSRDIRKWDMATIMIVELINE